MTDKQLERMGPFKRFFKKKPHKHTPVYQWENIMESAGIRHSNRVKCKTCNETLRPVVSTMTRFDEHPLSPVFNDHKDEHGERLTREISQGEYFP